MREELPTDFADERLSALLDGELDDVERKAVEDAVARDADLRRELEALRRTRDFLRKRGPVEAPPDFLAGVLAKVENEPMPANSPMASFFRRPFGLPIEGVAIAAAALLVVAGGVGGLGLFGGLGASTSKDSVTQEVQAPKTEAPAVASPAAAQQNVDPTMDSQAEVKPREIDLQGVKYGEQNFGGGVTAKDLGMGTGTRSVEGEGTGASVRDFTPAPAGAASPTTTTAPTTPPLATAASPKGTAPAVVPSLSSWRYRITSDRDEVLADLQSIAAKSGGRLTDREGRAVTGGSTSGGTFLLLVPTERVASVDTWLTKLGSERTGNVDASLYSSGVVAIQVDVMRFDQQDYKETSPAKPLPEKKSATPGQ